MKLTKMIATIGPATWDPEKIVELYKNGINIIRMNFSHKDYEEKERVITLVRQLNHENKTKLSLLMDNKGPEIRTGKRESKLEITRGAIFKLWIKQDNMGEQDLFCDYPYLLEDVIVGDSIKIDSGLLDAKVISIHQEYCECEALHTAIIGSYRHINLPGKKLKLPSLTEQDKEDLLFGIKHAINIVAMSFVRSAEHIRELRKFWSENGGGSIHIIAKIENQEGLDNLIEIIQESDGIMVARGDLGIEVPITLLPMYQEQIIIECHKQGKPVIVATQMIESMIKEPFPTRAEINDIYQAVTMGADCTMLSGETAIGSYPIQATHFMKQTIQTAEKNSHRKLIDFSDEGRSTLGLLQKHLVQSALLLAQHINAAGIVVFTKSGTQAKLLSAYKAMIPILACTRDTGVAEKLGYYYGVIGRTIQGKPDITFDWISSQCQIIDNPNRRPFVVVADTDTSTGHYPAIQVIG